MLKDKSFIFTPENEVVPNEYNPNKDENVDFSFSNFSSHFDEHINHSIRGYSDLRRDVVSISKYFIEDKTNVLDLGCSQGSLLKTIKDFNDQTTTTKYVGVDYNNDFKKHWDKLKEKNLTYKVSDVTKMKFPKDISYCVSLFTFQFLSERHRLPLFKKIYDNLIEGGCFITSEKVLSITGKIENIMEFIYYDYKKQHFSEKQIMDKEKQLRYLSKRTNENLLLKQLLGIGFRYIQPFWRNHNFVGYICLKLPKDTLDNE